MTKGCAESTQAGLRRSGPTEFCRHGSCTGEEKLSINIIQRTQIGRRQNSNGSTNSVKAYSDSKLFQCAGYAKSVKVYLVSLLLRCLMSICLCLASMSKIFCIIFLYLHDYILKKLRILGDLPTEQHNVAAFFIYSDDQFVQKLVHHSRKHSFQEILVLNDPLTREQVKDDGYNDLNVCHEKIDNICQQDRPVQDEQFKVKYTYSVEESSCAIETHSDWTNIKATDSNWMNEKEADSNLTNGKETEFDWTNEKEVYFDWTTEKDAISDIQCHPCNEEKHVDLMNVNVSDNHNIQCHKKEVDEETVSDSVDHHNEDSDIELAAETEQLTRRISVDQCAVSCTESNEVSEHSPDELQDDFEADSDGETDTKKTIAEDEQEDITDLFFYFDDFRKPRIVDSDKCTEGDNIPENVDVSFMFVTDANYSHLTEVLMKKMRKHEQGNRVLQSECSDDVSGAGDYTKVIRELTYLPPISLVTPATKNDVYILEVEKHSSSGSTDTARVRSIEADGSSLSAPPLTSLTSNTSSVTVTENTQINTSIPSQSSHETTVTHEIDLNSIDDVLRETALGRDRGPKVTMKFQLLRLCTLRNFPKENKPYISRLAAAGFYYAAQGDEVVCYSCGVRKSGWTANCDPMRTHWRLSPKCPFLTRNSEVNIPVPVRSDLGTDRFAFLQELIDNPPVIPSGDVHRSYDDNSTSTAAAAANSVTPAQEKTGPLKQKKKYNKAPKNPHYAVKNRRLNSFQGWPAEDIISAEVLAECGFYYAGLEDCVRCFHCGVGLRHWAVEDDPWIEHSRWTLENPCYFLVQMKGEEYVDLVHLAVELTDNMPSESENEVQAPESPNSEEEVSKGSSQLVVSTASSSTSNSGSTNSASSVSSNISRPTSENNAQLAVSGSSSRKGNLSEQRQLKLENERLKRQTWCMICYERSVCIVFLPCGHLVTCDNCAPTLRICPTCNASIKGTVKTYMS